MENPGFPRSLAEAAGACAAAFAPGKGQVLGGEQTGGVYSASKLAESLLQPGVRSGGLLMEDGGVFPGFCHAGAWEDVMEMVEEDLFQASAKIFGGYSPPVFTWAWTAKSSASPKSRSERRFPALILVWVV